MSKRKALEPPFNKPFNKPAQAGIGWPSHAWHEPGQSRYLGGRAPRQEDQAEVPDAADAPPPEQAAAEGAAAEEAAAASADGGAAAEPAPPAEMVVEAEMVEAEDDLTGAEEPGPQAAGTQLDDLTADALEWVANKLDLQSLVRLCGTSKHLQETVLDRCKLDAPPPGAKWAEVCVSRLAPNSPTRTKEYTSTALELILRAADPDMFADTRRAQPLVWPPYLVNSIRPATATQWLSADSASLAADGMRFARVCDYDLALGAGSSGYAHVKVKSTVGKNTLIYYISDDKTTQVAARNSGVSYINKCFSSGPFAALHLAKMGHSALERIQQLVRDAMETEGALMADAYHVLYSDRMKPLKPVDYGYDHDFHSRAAELIVGNHLTLLRQLQRFDGASAAAAAAVDGASAAAAAEAQRALRKFSQQYRGSRMDLELRHSGDPATQRDALVQWVFARCAYECVQADGLGLSQVEARCYAKALLLASPAVSFGLPGASLEFIPCDRCWSLDRVFDGEGQQHFAVREGDLVNLVVNSRRQNEGHWKCTQFAKYPAQTCERCKKTHSYAGWAESAMEPMFGSQPDPAAQEPRVWGKSFVAAVAGGNNLHDCFASQP